MALVLRGGLLITMNAERAVLTADILVEGDRIAALAPDLPPADSAGVPLTLEDVVDLSGKVVIPGLIQGHMHLTQALFRGLCDDLALMEWLRERIWPLEGAHSAASNAVSARLAAAELLRSGTTAVIDMGTVHHEDAIFETMRDVGMRGLFGKSLMDGGEGVPPSLLEEADVGLAETERLIHDWHMTGNGRLRYAVAPRFVPSCSKRLLASARDLARHNGLRLHTHASENLGEIALVESLHHMRNVVLLHKLGYTGKDVVLAHCIWLDDEEKKILADTGTHVAHCPSSNTKMASGIAPIVELRTLGVDVALGLDGAHNHMDALMEIRQASILQKARLHEPTALPALEALELATLGGASALGQADDLGSLEVGKKADLAVLDMDMLHTLPGWGRDPVQRVVYEATRENVVHTMIDGVFVYRDRQFLTLDLEQTLKDAERLCGDAARRAGLA